MLIDRKAPIGELKYRVISRGGVGAVRRRGVERCGLAHGVANGNDATIRDSQHGLAVPVVVSDSILVATRDAALVVDADPVDCESAWEDLSTARAVEDAAMSARPLRRMDGDPRTTTQWRTQRNAWGRLHGDSLVVST